MLNECNDVINFNSLVKGLLSFFDGNMLNEKKTNCNNARLLTS
jgi:hypothetical protein